MTLAVKKLALVREALAQHDRGLRESEEHNEIAQAFVERVRKIISARNGGARHVAAMEKR